MYDSIKITCAHTSEKTSTMLNEIESLKAQLRSKEPWEHPSETIVFHNEDGNPARANIKQALGYLKDGDGDGNSQPHKGVKASANSDVKYSFTSAQDGESLQDNVRLCLGNDLKKAQDHGQRQVSAFWSLNEDILKITILETNTSYPSRKIRRICACTHQRPQRNKAQYAVSEEISTPY
ncbi:hypothetical protein Tco_0401036 [Tanacetum coccineum]